MMDIKIEGAGRITAGEYNRIKIEGSGKVDGDIRFVSMDVEGACKVNGNLDGGDLEVEGSCKVIGNIKVKKLKIEGMLTSEKGKIYADEIKVDGMVSNTDEINADKIIINGGIRANDLFGDTIEIHSASLSGLVRFLHIPSFTKKHKLNHAKNIECSTMIGENVQCESLSANAIELTGFCDIEVIHCDGTLRYEGISRIGRIEGDCTRIVK